MDSTVSVRFRARWRSLDGEDREAVEVRREWMLLLGMDPEEVDMHLSRSFDLCLVDELAELSAAIDLCSMWCVDGKSACEIA